MVGWWLVDAFHLVCSFSRLNGILKMGGSIHIHKYLTSYMIQHNRHLISNYVRGMSGEGGLDSDSISMH